MDYSSTALVGQSFLHVLETEDVFECDTVYLEREQFAIRTSLLQLEFSDIMRRLLHIESQLQITQPIQIHGNAQPEIMPPPTKRRKYEK